MDLNEANVLIRNKAG